MDTYGAQRTIYTVFPTSAVGSKSLLNGSSPISGLRAKSPTFAVLQAGHLYFTLKDERSQLPAVWLSQRRDVSPVQAEERRVFSRPRPLEHV